MMHRVRAANGDVSSRHCPMHAKDFSDCIVYHFSWHYKCATRRSALGAILHGALQGRWGTPVQLRKCRTSGDAAENHDKDGSVSERHNERAVTEAGIMSTPSLPLQTRSDFSCARDSELLSGFRNNGDKPNNDSASTAVTGHSTSLACEEANDAKVQEVKGRSNFGRGGIDKTEETLTVNDAGSSKVTAKNYRGEEAEDDDNKSETPTWRNQKNRYHGDEMFNFTEQLKRNRERITDGMDPLEVLGMDLMLAVFSSLDAPSLACCGAVSKSWLTVARGDDLWRPQCDSLWENKAHFPSSALREGLTKMEAYSITVTESKRTRITLKDLCDHVWEFRFKEVAPEYWLSLDPSSQGRPPMLRYFHGDGSQTAGANDPVWGGHECRFYLIDIPLDTQNCCRYVRINHWPMMTVSRTQNWGWELNNEIYVYNSIPDYQNLGGTGSPLNVN